MSRCEAIAKEFLLWLSQQQHEPDPLEFLTVPALAADGEPVMPGELQAAVVYIERHGLIRGHWRDSPDRIPGRVSLNDRGWQCVNSYDGNVATWHRATTS